MVVTISADSDDPHSVIASAVCEDLKTLTDVEGQLDRMWDTYDSLTELPVEESEPYKYYYKARELLEIARESLKRKLAANETSDTENLEWHLANIDLAMGRNLFWCEEVSKAEVRFLRALKLGLLSSNRLEKKYVFFILDCLQQLSNIWLGRADYTKAINFLARAALLHKAVEDRVEWEDADMENLDRTKTLTAYGLARAYGGLGMISSASRACSMTLARQLEHNMAGSDDPGRKKDAPFDYREWSRNAISLADYYIGRGEFWTAEYLMHAGRIIATEWPPKIGEEKSDELVAELRRDIGRFYRTRLEMSNVHAGRTADECLAFWRCKAEVIEKKLTEEQASAIQWGSLSNDDVERREVRWDAENGFPEKVTIRDGYAVFDGTSAMQEEVREGTGGVGNPEEQVLNLSKEILVRSAVSFPSIHEAIERAMRTHNTAFLAAHGPTIDHRKQLTYCANGFTTARELFKVAQYFDQQALSVFVLDGYASDHIQTVQELARLHEALEFWESDPKRLIGLLKRRVKLLEPVLEEINPTVYVQFYRQLSYEIGDIYKQLSDGIIGSQGEEYEVGVPHPVSGPEEARQLRRYISKAVKSFTRFLDSFKAPTQNGPLGVQDELDDSAIPHIITAREHIARLLSKEPSTSPMERLESLTTALSHYEWVRDYAWHHKEQISRSPKENQEAVRLTSEMAELVPVQIARLKSALSR